MSHNQPVHAAVRRPGSTVLAVLIAALVAVGAIVVVLGQRSSTGSSSEAGHPQAMTRPGAHHSAASPPRRQGERLSANVPGEPPVGLRSRELGVADGEVADGTTVFADVAAVTKLDPTLLTALRSAASDAAAVGVELDVNSGWRSYGYQAELFDEAVASHGSRTQAERWVARPGTSVHEAGDAVDIGPSSATTWLAGHGAAFGLCQVYANEPWHYELRPDADDQGCPATYADPTHDPRMRP